ncbi:hypothetical protein D3C75_688600 [compost metagenome]
MPVRQIAEVGLRPVPQHRHPGIAAGHQEVPVPLLGGSAGSNLRKAGVRLFHVAACHIVRPPFHMEEAVRLPEFIQRVGFVLGINPPVPARPDRGGIHIHDILAEFAAADRRHPGVIQSVGQLMQLLHKAADGFLIEVVVVPFPVIFIAQSPDNDGRVVVMLVDHGPEHVPALRLVRLIAQPAAAPGNLLPYQ